MLIVPRGLTDDSSMIAVVSNFSKSSQAWKDGLRKT